MTANVSIITNKSENVLCIPNMALKYTFMQGKEVQRYENQGVWVLKGVYPTRVEIETGIVSDSFTEVVEGDLNEGDNIVIEQLSKGSKEVGGKRPMRMF